jgi:hypothetical protein
MRYISSRCGHVTACFPFSYPESFAYMNCNGTMLRRYAFSLVFLVAGEHSRGIPKCDTVRLTPITLTLSLHCHIHTQARKIPILVIVARSHSHSVGHTHTRLVILTLKWSYSHSIGHTHTPALGVCISCSELE